VSDEIVIFTKCLGSVKVRVPKDTPTRPGNYIYCLRDPRDMQIRYVGKTAYRLRDRLRAHIREAGALKHSHKSYWIKELLLIGSGPVIDILEETSSELLAEREVWWISEMRKAGIPLVNQTDGGEGMLNPSPATRAKLRAKKPHIPTEEELARRSAAQKLSWQSPERRANQLAGIKRRYPGPSRYERSMRKDSDEFRQWKIENAKRMGAINKGKKKSEEHRQKLSEATKRQHAEGRVAQRTDEERRQSSERMRALWRTERFRQRMEGVAAEQSKEKSERMKALWKTSEHREKIHKSRVGKATVLPLEELWTKK